MFALHNILPGSAKVSKNLWQRCRYGHFKLLYASSRACCGSVSLNFDNREIGSSTGRIDFRTGAFTSGVEADLDDIDTDFVGFGSVTDSADSMEEIE